MQTENKIRGGKRQRDRRERDPSPHRSQIRISPSSAAGSRSLTAAKPASPPGRSHHTRAPSAVATAAGSGLFLCITVAAAAGRGTRGQAARGEPGAPRAGAWAGPDRAGERAERAGAGPDRRQRRLGSLSPRSHTARAAGRSSLPGRMSSGSPPLASPWGSSVEALKTGGRGPSWARRAPRHLCGLAERGAGGWASGRRLEGGGGERGWLEGAGRGEGTGRWQSYQVSAFVTAPGCRTLQEAQRLAKVGQPRAAGTPRAGALQTGAAATARTSQLLGSWGTGGGGMRTGLGSVPLPPARPPGKG
ncbi:collagen alpha-1(I) chain-like [Cavia porcellus]|uniref:collagen alpha-1(I) chain-like n=1 Tax=Cavia porcellus TaxID=10141 RepID=UPI002FE11C8B